MWVGKEGVKWEWNWNKDGKLFEKFTYFPIQNIQEDKDYKHIERKIMIMMTVLHPESYIIWEGKKYSGTTFLEHLTQH
jgi:hypothetical protein